MWWYGYAAGLMGGVALGVGAFSLIKLWIDHKSFLDRQQRWQERQQYLDMMMRTLGPPTGPGGGTVRYGPSRGLPDGTRVATYRPRTKLTVVGGGKEGE